jgi:dihydroneopterin aldolase
MVEHILHLQEEMLDYIKNISMKVRNRKILINNLIVQASVGVYEHEKQNKQKIIVNVELLLSNDSQPKQDNLESTQDYSQFRKCLIDIIQSQHFHLLEVLVEKIHSTLMINSYVIGAKVNICKPNIFKDCEVAYELSNI